MQISLNIVLDGLRDYDYDVHVKSQSERSFQRIALLPNDKSKLSAEKLYICKISEAMRWSQDNRHIVFLCLRDPIQDKTETEKDLTGLIVVNDNIDIEQLFFDVQDIFFKVFSWINQMQEAVIQSKSMQEILNLSTDVIGNYIAITDSALKLLAYTTSIPCDDRVCVAAQKNGYHPEETIRLFKKERRFEMWESNKDFYIDDKHAVSPYTLVGKVFKFRDTYFTHSVMTCNNREPTPGILDLYLILVDFIALYSARDWEEKDAYSHSYDSLLTDLIEGNLTEQETIENRAKYLNIPYEGRYNLAKIPIAPSGNYSAGRMGQELSDLFPTARILLYHQNVILLNPFDISRQDEQLESLQAKLIDFLQRYDLYCGISSVFTTLADCHMAFSQSIMALKYSEQVNAGRVFQEPFDPNSSSKGRKQYLFSFEESLLYCALSDSPQLVKLWRMSSYGQALNRLYRYDQNHGTNNLQMLYVYLSCERKIRETSALMHLHRNTIVYRVERIEEMLGIDLNDAKKRLKVLLTFTLMRLHGFDE